MQNASFFVWDYSFYGDRVEISRNFVLTRKSVLYIDKIEMAVLETDPFFKHFGRCNLLLTFAGNIFTLFGLPLEVAEAFCEQVGYTHPALPTEHAQGEMGQITLSNADLLKKSLLRSRWRWYPLLLAALWGAVFLMGSRLITSETAHAISDFVFRHMITAGTLVLSLGLPTAMIWFWAFTGGFLVEFLKYYHYTATRKANVLCFEYGLFLHRRVYISADRIAITEFKQPPLMQIFGCGRLDVRAVGYNPFFLKSQPILPFVRASSLPAVLEVLLPEIKVSDHPPCCRSLGYDFLSRKWLLPIACVLAAILFGWSWLIAALLAALLVLCSILLEYKNTDFSAQNGAVSLSTGGFYRKTAWLYFDRIEMISTSASRQKRRQGFVNLRLRVFGKRGTYALVRNIDAECVGQLDEKNN